MELTFFWKNNYEEFIKNNKLVSKTQQIFKSESHNVFTEEINKIALMIKEYNEW